MRRARGSLRLAQLRTVALLFGGYAACYYCRADLSVATPLLVEELGRRGVSHGEALIRIGLLSSLGVAAYALGSSSSPVSATTGADGATFSSASAGQRSSR
jgi:sugar phosphate permease